MCGILGTIQFLFWPKFCVVFWAQVLHHFHIPETQAYPYFCPTNKRCVLVKISDFGLFNFKPKRLAEALTVAKGVVVPRQN